MSKRGFLKHSSLKLLSVPFYNVIVIGDQRHRFDERVRLACKTLCYSRCKENLALTKKYFLKAKLEISMEL